MAFAGLLALFFVPVAIKAQVSTPYGITNNLTCAVEVTYNLFDSTCSPNGCPPTSTGVVIIPAGATKFLSTCTGLTDIEITINWITATTCPATQTPAWASSALTCGGSNTAVATIAGACACTSANLTVTGGGATIN